MAYPLDILKLERVSENKVPGITSLHCQKAFELIWIQDGEGMHIVNGEYYRFSRNTIYAALPGQHHELYFSTGSKGYILSFNSTHLARLDFDYNHSDESYLLQHFSKEPVLVLLESETDQIENLITLLEKESSSRLILQGEILSRYLQLFHLYLRRNIEANAPTFNCENSSFLMRNFLALIELNFRIKKTVLDYALDLNVSPNYLNNTVKKTSGYTASYHIRQRIVQEAKRKARHSGFSMKEAAYYLGFEDTAHFSRYFKQTCGINYSEFRKLNQGAPGLPGQVP